MLDDWIYVSEILVCSTLSLSPVSVPNTDLSLRDSTSSLSRGDSIGVVHRATRVSIDCIGLVCVREFIVFFVFIVFFAFSLSPSFGFRVNRKIGPHTGS